MPLPWSRRIRVKLVFWFARLLRVPIRNTSCGAQFWSPILVDDPNIDPTFALEKYMRWTPDDFKRNEELFIRHNAPRSPNDV
jgi:hypothetical protein